MPTNCVESGIDVYDVEQFTLFKATSSGLEHERWQISSVDVRSSGFALIVIRAASLFAGFLQPYQNRLRNRFSCTKFIRFTIAPEYKMAIHHCKRRIAM